MKTLGEKMMFVASVVFAALTIGCNDYEILAQDELLDVSYKLEELEILENVDETKDGLIVERDLQDSNRLDAKIPCDVVNGLHVFAGRVDLLL